MPGLLFVYSEPGAAVPLDEFNDWYDNEHIPLSIPVPSFHSWSRWAAADGKQPSHLALYDIDSPAAVNDIPSASFTARDHSILARLALVNMCTYTLHESVYPPASGTAYDTRAPGPFLSCVAMDVPAEHVADYNRWYDEEEVPLLSRTPGWVRTRRFVFADVRALGTDESLRQALGPHKFLALHEWESTAALGTEEYRAAISTPGALKFKEIATRSEQRLFKLHKVWGRE